MTQERIDAQSEQMTTGWTALFHTAAHVQTRRYISFENESRVQVGVEKEDGPHDLRRHAGAPEHQPNPPAGDGGGNVGKFEGIPATSTLVSVASPIDNRTRRPKTRWSALR